MKYQPCKSASDNQGVLPPTLVAKGTNFMEPYGANNGEPLLPPPTLVAKGANFMEPYGANKDISFVLFMTVSSSKITRQLTLAQIPEKVATHAGDVV